MVQSDRLNVWSQRSLSIAKNVYGGQEGNPLQNGNQQQKESHECYFWHLCLVYSCSCRFHKFFFTVTGLKRLMMHFAQKKVLSTRHSKLPGVHHVFTFSDSLPTSSTDLCSTLHATQRYQLWCPLRTSEDTSILTQYYHVWTLSKEPYIWTIG